MILNFSGVLIVNKLKKSCWFYASILLLALSATVRAQVPLKIVQVTNAATLVPEQLFNTMDFYAQAVSRSIKTAQPSSTKIKLLASKWRSATIARFEYTYAEPSGASNTRIYNAISGQDPQDILYEPGSAPNRQFNDFLSSSNIEKAAANIDVPGGRLGASMDNQALDAELKALKNFENDILVNGLPPGGKLVGYISQAPCDSCANVLRQQLPATGYARQIEVSYLPNSKAVGISQTETDIAKRFNTRRLVYKDNILSLRAGTLGRLEARGGELAGCL
ncbi:MAG: hypothetical protein QOC89_1925 [Paraburkholderia sp.]|jgi:hypothetical protein|nr:hypothetical protein [Paraburkholderia sp.]